MTTPFQNSFYHGRHDKSKCKQFEAELKRVRKYLSTHTATSTMVAVALNIYRPNLCRHKGILKKEGVLIELYKATCKITGFEASYLTCDPALMIGGHNDRK
jgi:hypothetical protein